MQIQHKDQVTSRSILTWKETEKQMEWKWDCRESWGPQIPRHGLRLCWRYICLTTTESKVFQNKSSRRLLPVKFAILLGTTNLSVLAQCGGANAPLWKSEHAFGEGKRNFDLCNWRWLSDFMKTLLLETSHFLLKRRHVIEFCSWINSNSQFLRKLRWLLCRDYLWSWDFQLCIWYSR